MRIDANIKKSNQLHPNVNATNQVSPAKDPVILSNLLLDDKFADR